MSPEKLTFGVVPFVDDAGARRLLQDFCAALSDLLGLAVAPHAAPSPAALAEALEAGIAEVAWLSPTLFAACSSRGGVTPIASSVREGRTSFHAALFVLQGSPIEAPEGLAGARAAWVAPTSAAGYIFPRLALTQRGLDVARLFASEVFLASHGAVAAAVQEGRADVGATFLIFEQGDPARPIARAGFMERGGAAAIRVLLQAGPIPADVIAARSTVPTPLRARILDAMQSLARDPETAPTIRALFGAQGFEPLSDESLSVLPVPR